MYPDTITPGSFFSTKPPLNVLLGLYYVLQVHNTGPAQCYGFKATGEPAPSSDLILTCQA